MNNELVKTSRRSWVWIFRISLCLLLLTLVAGCTASYGRLKRDSDVFQEFMNNQVSTDFKYYYYGFANRPYAVIGVDARYDAGSKLWRTVEPNTEEFKKMTVWIWEDFGYYRFGAQILDPAGNQIGVMYTAIREVAIKFPGDNRLEVIPHTPFLWGPGADAGDASPYLGSLAP